MRRESLDLREASDWLLLHSSALEGFSSFLVTLCDFQTLIFFFYIDELAFSYKEKFPLLHLCILSIKCGTVIIYFALLVRIPSNCFFFGWLQWSKIWLLGTSDTSPSVFEHVHQNRPLSVVDILFWVPYIVLALKSCYEAKWSQSYQKFLIITTCATVKTILSHSTWKLLTLELN